MLFLLCKVQNSKYPEDEACIQKEYMNGPNIGYVRISYNTLTQPQG